VLQYYKKVHGSPLNIPFFDKIVAKNVVGKASVFVTANLCHPILTFTSKGQNL
jgi:hypothetical protein